MSQVKFCRSSKVIGLLALCAFLALPVGLLAQVTGSISGFITDPTGAAVPGAKVTATLVSQNFSINTTSNDQGFYQFTAVQPGTYTVVLEKSGFQRLTHTNVVVTVSQPVRLDLLLTLGQVTQSVEVSAAPTLVNTTSGTTSGLIDDSRVVDLPLNGRNVVSLAITVPGVLNVTAPQNLTDARSGPQMDVGSRSNMNMFTLNGAYFNQPSRNTGMNPPPPDAVQEFRIQTSDFDAEYGHDAGSQVTIVTKSGTNQYHGDAFEFLRNDALNARNFFSATRPTLKENQFGGAGGGPIWKSKHLFGFGSYQGLRILPQAQAIVAHVPSAAERDGDFSALPAGSLVDPIDPLTGRGLVDSSGNPCVQKDSGGNFTNIINPNCISPVSKNLLQYVPQSPSGTIIALGSQPQNENEALARIDWNQSSKHSLFGTFFYDKNNLVSPFYNGGNILGYDGTSEIEETDEWSLNDTYTFSPTLLNQLVGSFLRTTSNQINSRTIVPSDLGIQNFPQYAPTGIVGVNVGGLFDLGSGSSTRFINNNWQARDAVTKIAGNHTIKFGGDVLHLHFIQRFLNTPQFSFTGSRSGNAVADFLLGAYDSLGTSFGVRDNDDQTVLPSFFFQDEWKVKPRFTLTLGLRWEPYNFWHDNHDRINTFQAGAQSTVVPDAPPGFLFPGDQDLGRSFVKSDRSNLAPRLGFAWDVFGNGKTSVRGAYGVFYEGINADSLAQSNAPFAGAVTTNTGLIGDPFGSVGQTPPPSVLTGQFGCVKISTPPGVHCPLFPLPAFGFFLDQSLRTPYIQEWNLTIQRQLTPNIMLETGYIGKIGIKLGELRYFDAAGFIPGTTYNSTTGVETTLSSPQNVNARVPYEPGILTPGSVTLGSDFRSWYHGWMTQVTKRMSHNMEFVASYTLSKAIDMDSSPNSGSPGSNPFYLLSDRGRSDWDRRHAFVASFVWSPIPHFNNPWMNKTFSNWTVTGIETVQSGTPLTFLSGQDLALNGSGGSEHAFLTGDPIALDHSSRGAMVNEFFNTGAFVRGQCKFVAQNGNPTVIEQENCTPFGSVYSLLGQYGNAGRGILSGPALANLDFSVIKDIPITERYKLQFRSEFFNALNQVNFSNPRTTVNSGTFGQIQSARDGRVIQFALKLFF